MSGGSWDYVYCKFQEVADRLSVSPCVLRRALGEKVELVANALHDIEWVDSFDKSKGSEFESIRKVLGEKVDAAGLLLTQEIKKAKEAFEQLKQAIATAESIQSAIHPERTMDNAGDS
jgi:phage tail tape-measure protein